MSSGGGPLLGRGPGRVGQSGAAAAPNEAPGGMPEDLSRAVFRGKCLPGKTGSDPLGFRLESRDLILRPSKSRMAQT